MSVQTAISLYGLDTIGRQTGTFNYEQTGRLMRLNMIGMSLDFSLSELLSNLGKKKSGDSSGASESQGTQGPEHAAGPGQTESTTRKTDAWGYTPFKVPWTMNLSYTLNYSKPAFTGQLVQTLAVNGGVTLTPKMNMTYTSGYDFARKEITMTQIGITRDLHCWDMSFNWVPNGYMKMWTFTIRVKASVLADLKYERRKDFHDNY
jgi:hypothetical protein